MKREPRCFLFRFYFPASRMASTAFCTCRRFSASSKISGACCSNTAEEISSPRWAGRQCSTMTSGLALSSSLPVSWKPTKSRRRCSLSAVPGAVVFHAAAYKHVPLMEENPCEAIRTNVFGTRVMADAAVSYGVEKFVMISTDKAVNPTNIMGCSKRLAEIYVQSLSLAIERGEVKGETRFITTRFGNVLGSNGSVIPRFREQIAQGGPVTVTHPDIIRYFMTIPEACRLVLEAGTMGKGGEIFIFDMGEPVKIADLAKRMIELSGLQVNKDIEIKYTGLRPGEKLYEELLNNKENTKETPHEKIRVAAVREYDYKDVITHIHVLIELSLRVQILPMVREMKAFVPEFKSQNSRFEELD